MKKIIIYSFAIFASLFCVKAQFVQNSSRSLFSDVKAYKTGDAVTILIVEDMQADNSATTGTSSKTNLGAGVNVNTGKSNTNLELGLNSSNAFQGSGQASRNESIRSKITAKVDSVDRYGNLAISGKRLTKVNGEQQTVIISGKIRPVDILPNNSIYSYSIQELTLFIEGEGVITKAQEPGLLTKFLRILF